MATEQVRLSDEAIEALRSYAPNHPLSTAILLMHKEVTTRNRVLEEIRTSSNTKPLQPVTEPKVMTEATSTLKGFSRGNGLPSPVESPHVTEQKKLARQYLADKTTVPGEPKKYGKLDDPEDQLIEPRGFGGKKV